MSVMTVLPQRHHRPFTRADLASMPDDGRRYELIDGEIIVTPLPSVPHQRAATRLARVLEDAAPDDAEAFGAPVGVFPADDTEMQPDVLVARRADLTRKGLPAAPLLVVEILSPSTRRFDLGLKRERYERAGALAYWVFDPDRMGLRAWELRDGAYVQVADVSGDEAFETDVPFPVRVIPGALV